MGHKWRLTVKASNIENIDVALEERLSLVSGMRKHRNLS